MNFAIHNQAIVAVFPETLDELGLSNGQNINTDTFWKVIGFNATLGLSKCVIAKAKNNENNLD